jgi:hypothetical protein
LQHCHLKKCWINLTSNQGTPRLILEDSIHEDGKDSIALLYPRDGCSIQRNIFSRSGGLVTFTSGSVKVIVAHNLFYNWPEPFSAVVNGATYSSSQTIVTSNSFLSTGRIALRLPSGLTDSAMTATNNFWNTTNIDLISSMIFDRNDDLGCAGYISYTPILTSSPAAIPTVNSSNPDDPDPAVRSELVCGGKTNPLCERGRDWGSPLSMAVQWRRSRRRHELYADNPLGQPNASGHLRCPGS